MTVKPSPANEPTRPVDIEPSTFPDRPRQGYAPPATIDNVRHLLKENGVTVRYNVIKKRLEIRVPWAATTVDNGEDVAMTHILSLASRYGMATGLVPHMVSAIGDEAPFNPAAEWMRSSPWDGKDRFPGICATLTPRDDYPTKLRDALVTTWLISVAAAATMLHGFRSRGVLTLQGGQGLGKTSWGLSLVNDPVLRDQLVKVDHHLDASNKDSVLGAIEHLIVEIGEVDSSFRRDVSRMKGFLTSGSDKVRRPYGKATSEYQRRTVFYATVNASTFLVDETGNTRFWTIPCVHIDFKHDIDMQQVFAQCLHLLEQGASWFLSSEEEQMLEQENAKHRSFSMVRERLESVIDRDADERCTFDKMTATEILQESGLEYPTNVQAKECASLLREWFGEPSRIQGRYKWRVSLRSNNEKPLSTIIPIKSKFD